MPSKVAVATTSGDISTACKITRLKKKSLREQLTVPPPQPAWVGVKVDGSKTLVSFALLTSSIAMLRRAIVQKQSRSSTPIRVEGCAVTRLLWARRR